MNQHWIRLTSISSRIKQKCKFLLKTQRRILVHLDNADLCGDYVMVRGWAIADLRILRVEVFLQQVFIGEARYGLERPDVVHVYPGFANGLHSGFTLSRRINLPTSSKASLFLRVKVSDESGNSEEIIFPVARQAVDSAVDKEKNQATSVFYAKKTIQVCPEMIFTRLACPDCLNPVPYLDHNLFRCQCGAEYKIIDGVPLFLAYPIEYQDQRAQTNPTNPYSDKNLVVINNHPDALILDFGAGNPKPKELFDNVVRMDVLHYRNIHVVSNKRNIPFQDDTFDFVISESVFEHVRDPWHYAQELHRVLKPGGKILIDTAFLQPVHGDPYHFYNMTLMGLEETFKMFTKLESGVEPYQTASFTLNILRDYYLSLITDEQAKSELTSRIGSIDFVQYDQYIPQEKQSIMSAGVYFIGSKEAL